MHRPFFFFQLLHLYGQFVPVFPLFQLVSLVTRHDVCLTHLETPNFIVVEILKQEIKKKY